MPIICRCDGPKSEDYPKANGLVETLATSLSATRHKDEGGWSLPRSLTSTIKVRPQKGSKGLRALVNLIESLGQLD